MIITNSIIETLTERASIRYRVIAILETQRVILFELPRAVTRTIHPPIKLTTCARADLEASITDGDAKVLDLEPFSPYRDESESNPETKAGSTASEARRDQAHQVVSWVIADGYEPLVARETRFARINEAATKFKCLPRTVRRWIGRYLTYGMVPNALYPLHRKKGLRGKRQTVSKVKRGRTATFSAKNGCNVSQDIRDKIQKHTKREMLKGKRTLRQLYDSFCQKYFVDGKEVGEDGKETVVLLPQASKITYSAFIKYYYKDRNATELSRLQHGHRHDLDHREKLGCEAERALFAGAYLQIDFTIANVVLVHPIQRTPIGRPLTGLGCDVFSMFQAGMLATMENASALQAMLLLENIFSEKVEFCRRLGIPITPEAWPGGFLWNQVVADNGELRGKMSRLIAQNLDIRFTHTAPLRPEQKGSIESSMANICGHEIALLPGTVPRQRQRGDKPCGLDEKRLDLQAYRKIVALALIHRNSQWIDNHYLSLQAQADRVPPRPLDIFNHSIRTMGALRKAPSPDILRFLTFPRAKAVIDGKGIIFKGLYYTNSEIHQSGAYVLARKSGRRYVVVVYDPRLVDVIYLVLDASDPQLIPCFLGPRSQQYGGHGLSFEDVHALAHDHDYRHAESSDHDQQRQIDFKGEINNVLEEQKDRNNAAKGTTRTFGTTATKEARSAAGKACAQEDARVLGQPEEKNGKIIRIFHDNHAPAATPEPSPNPEITPKDARDNLLDKFFKNK